MMAVTMFDGIGYAQLIDDIDIRDVQCSEREALNFSSYQTLPQGKFAQRSLCMEVMELDPPDTSIKDTLQNVVLDEGKKK